jgi:hypothetical protein
VKLTSSLRERKPISIAISDDLINMFASKSEVLLGQGQYHLR